MTGSFVETQRESLPVVPLRDMVVFPHMMAPFIVGRESSVKALEVALAGSHIRVRIAEASDHYDGDSANNIVNRLTAGGANGVQIEQPLQPF